MDSITKIPGQWPENRRQVVALYAVTFVLQWFWIRLGWAQESIVPTDHRAGFKPPVFALTGWTVPLTGFFGIRSVHVGHWMIWLRRSNGRPRFFRFAKKKRAAS